MSKSPVYIGAGSQELAVTSAQNIIDNANDISLKLQTIEEWVTLTDGTTVFDFVDNEQTTEYSAKEYAQGIAATGGTAKQWALGGGSHVEATEVITGKYSARKYATDAAASASTAEGYVDAFDDDYLGSHTTVARETGSNVGKDNDGDALADGALYYDTTLEVMKVWNDTGSVWKQLTPTSGDQTNIDLVVANPLATNIGLVAAIDDKVTEVAAIDDKVTDVANITAGDVSKVADITTGDVSKVADITTGDVSKVAVITTGDVSKVAVITTGDVSKVAAITTGDVSKVADITTGNVTKVAAVDAEVVRLGVDIHTTASTGNLARLGTAAMATASTGHLAYLGTSAMANTTDGYLKVLGNATVTADLAILGSTVITDDMALLAIPDVIDDMETVSNNLVNINNFADLYQIDDFSPADPNTDGGGNALSAGDLAFDTTAGEGLKVWTGAAWSGTINTTEGVIVKQEYTANGSTQHYVLDHDQGMEIVYLNGVKLLSGDGSNNNDYFSVSGGSSTTYVGDGNTATHIYFHTAPTNTFVISVVAWGASNNTLAVGKTGGTYSGLVTFASGLTVAGAWTAASQTCADLGTVTTGAFTTITDLGNVTTTGTIGLGGKLTAGSTEIEGSNFDIDGGDISSVTISGGLTWSAAQNLNHQNLTNVDIDSGSIDGAAIGQAAPSLGTFTTLNATTINGTDINADLATNNIGIGATALNSVTSGNYNVAFGALALTAVTGTSESVAIGHQACEDNTAAECTAVGTKAMMQNVGGTGNTAVGHSASLANVSGVSNTSVGYKTLYNNTGSANTGMGWAALHNNTADLNTAVGYAALYTNTTGSFCTAIGYEALSLSNTNTDNTAVGHQALKNCVVGSGAQTGAKNVAVGGGALAGVTDGYQNTAMGYLAGYQMAGGRDNVAIGYGAMYAGTGNVNTAVGWQAGLNISTGGGSVLIGAYSGTSVSPVTVTSTSDIGCWGSNLTGPNYIDTDWTVTSDERDKADIVSMTHGLDVLENITPINYFWDKRTYYWDTSDMDNIIKHEGDGSKKRSDLRLGFSAQKVKAVLDAVGYTGHSVVDSRDEENLKITNSNIIPFLVNAVKELSAR